MTLSGTCGFGAASKDQAEVAVEFAVELPITRFGDAVEMFERGGPGGQNVPEMLVPKIPVLCG